VRSIIALATPAYAGSHQTGGGGGRLSQVSAGVRGAVASTPTPAGSSVGDLSTESNYIECGSCQSVILPVPIGASGSVAVAPQPQPGATVEGYAAAQKVFESTGSVSLALSVVDQHLRFNVGVTQYYEDRMDGGRLTMMMPSLSAGVRLDTGGPTQLWLEGGATAARIKGDPAGDSTLVAPMLGMALGFLFMRFVRFAFARARPSTISRIFSRGQLLSAATVVLRPELVVRGSTRPLN